MTTTIATGSDDRPRLIVRLRERKPTERMGHNPERYVLECGYEGRTIEKLVDGSHSTKEKGRMVAMLFDSEDQVVDALHAVAEMWAKQRRRDPAAMGRIVVPTFN